MPRKRSPKSVSSITAGLKNTGKTSLDIGGKAKENGKERKPGANPLISALYQIFSISHIAPRGQPQLKITDM